MTKKAPGLLQGLCLILYAYIPGSLDFCLSRFGYPKSNKLYGASPRSVILNSYAYKRLPNPSGNYNDNSLFFTWLDLY